MSNSTFDPTDLAPFIFSNITNGTHHPAKTCFYLPRKSHGFVNKENVFNSDLALLLCQITIIMVFARCLGLLFKFIKEPMVVAEMVSGIVLGPSILGQWDWWRYTFFPKDSLVLLNIISQFGIVLFMFLVGLELNLSILKKDSVRVIAVGVLGIVGPMITAVPTAIILNSSEFYDTDKVGFGIFFFFIGIVMSIAAIPVLARILSEFGLMEGRTGVYSLTIATFDDFVGWPMLAIAISLAGVTEKLSALYEILFLIADVLLIFFVVRWLFNFLDRTFSKKDAETAPQIVIYLYFVILFAISFFSEIIGVTGLIGAFLVGAVVPRRPRITIALSHFEDLVVMVFLPIYFANSGLKTDLSQLNSGKLWGFTIATIFLAFIGKGASIALSAKLMLNTNWGQSSLLAVMMNTKGLVALVTLNLGLEAAIITTKTFAMFIIMVIILTCLTGPLTHLLYYLFKGSFKDAPEDTELGKISVMVCAEKEQDTILLSKLAAIFFPANVSSLTIVCLTEESERPSDYMSWHTTINSNNIMKSLLKIALAMDPQFQVQHINCSKQEFGPKVCFQATVNDSQLMVIRCEHNKTITGRVVQSVLANAPCDVMIVFGKKFSKYNPQKVQDKVLFVQTGSEVAKKYVALLEKAGVTVVMLALGDQDVELEMEDKPPSIKDVSINSPVFLNLENELSQSGNEYTMVVCGFVPDVATRITRLSSLPVILFSAKSNPDTS
eukprot:TRINITY_DN9226_c0_g1_i1.p1 TRINITY_DN9226_c0_g1~~TRINITY_DN9226_c0_g1_i1.p1  ORF type:complete len:722 (-),score=101.21 TRINITY_DN9226_c0_g1_i1:53-2218(-)